MPEPQTGTSTVVATDVETGTRLGIRSHSLGTATARVKSRWGVPTARTLPVGLEATTLPASMTGRAASITFLAAILVVAIL